jgi:hypothetical protein
MLKSGKSLVNPGKSGMNSTKTVKNPLDNKNNPPKIEVLFLYLLFLEKLESGISSFK